MKNLIVFVFVTVSLIGSVFAAGQIDIAYSPYTISKPGSYIVVKDLTTAQNLDCIDINTSNVTIDLNGHTLYGSGTSAGVGIYDISYSDNNMAIFNGTVRDFYSGGILIYGLNTRIERVNVYNNGSNGISLYSQGLIINCNASNNGSSGISLTSNGSVFDCNVYNNGYCGIACAEGGIIRNNNVWSNSYIGIYADYGVVVTGNQATSNQSDGINCSDATATGNYCYGNIHNGITAYYSSVENNTVDGNEENGVYAQESRVIGNYSQSNGPGAGIIAFNYNTLENNNLYGNTTGIFATGTHNYIAGNRLTGNTLSISTVAGNTLGNGSTGFLNITY
jgi:hypothetical protein